MSRQLWRLAFPSRAYYCFRFQPGSGKLQRTNTHMWSSVVWGGLAGTVHG